MKIVSWNVNSIKMRLPRVLSWIEANHPDILCLQETKTVDDSFPHQPFTDIHYHAHIYGQKSYNGVAFITKQSMQHIENSLGDPQHDPQARLIRGQIEDVHIVNVYVPNGSEVDSDKFIYKQNWLARLYDDICTRYTPDTPLIICGDFNIAPRNCDVSVPEKWKDSVLCHASVRQALDHFMQWGFIDIFSQKYPDGGVYSWWNYRELSFAKNNGLRIDLMLVTKPVAQRTLDLGIDRDERKGKQPSDHVPVWIDVKI